MLLIETLLITAGVAVVAVAVAVVVAVEGMGGTAETGADVALVLL